MYKRRRGDANCDATRPSPNVHICLYIKPASKVCEKERVASMMEYNEAARRENLISSAEYALLSVAPLFFGLSPARV